VSKRRRRDSERAFWLISVCTGALSWPCRQHARQHGTSAFASFGEGTDAIWKRSAAETKTKTHLGFFPKFFR